MQQQSRAGGGRLCSNKLQAELGPSYADLSFSSSYERQLDKRHGQILIHDASFRFMFLYVILISQTWLDLPAEQRLADRDLRMAGCCWLAMQWLWRLHCRTVESTHCTVAHCSSCSAVAPATTGLQRQGVARGPQAADPASPGCATVAPSLLHRHSIAAGLRGGQLQSGDPTRRSSYGAGLRLY